MLLHTEASAFTRRNFYPLLQANASTHRHFYKHTTLHTDDAFTHGPFYTQTLLHTEALKQKKEHLETKKKLNAYTNKRFYIQGLLDTVIIIYRSLQTQKALYTKIPFYKNNITQRNLYAQTLL